MLRESVPSLHRHHLLHHRSANAVIAADAIAEAAAGGRQCAPGDSASGSGASLSGRRDDDFLLGQSRPSTRVLIVDDNPAIHRDFSKILSSERKSDLDMLEDDLFEEVPTKVLIPRLFTLDSAFQGQEALGMVRRAMNTDRPYAVAFVDVRMPPGWDGLETVARIWKIEPRLQVVLCTAYSDHTWEDIHNIVSPSDNLLFLKKPFDVPEVRQLAHALATKWELMRDSEKRMHELEGKVAERTQALADANERLRHEMNERARAENELRRAQRLEALGRLAAGIGHEINNPLTFMVAGLENARSEIDNQSGQLPPSVYRSVTELLDAATIGADRIAQIVRNIKLVARPTDQTLDAVNVASVLDLSLKIVSHEISEDIRITTAMAPKMPLVLGKRVAIEQVFVNLIKNAAQALEEKSRRYTAELSQTGKIEVRTYEDGDYVVVDIADNGPGIAPEYISRIFDPFFTTKSVDRGTGLGLSICQTIIKQLGGHIEAHSTLGRGTIMRVKLPALHVGNREVTRDTEPPPADVERGTILVVDDEPLVLRVILQALRDHEVVGVTSGRAAMSRIGAQGFDLILCDLMMPGMSGMDIYHRVKDEHPGLEERIVFITGGSLFDEVREFLTQVPNISIEKPIEPTRLSAKVAKLLRRYQD